MAQRSRSDLNYVNTGSDTLTRVVFNIQLSYYFIRRILQPEVKGQGHSNKKGKVIVIDPQRALPDFVSI